jgi:hypothetical protein
LTPWILVDFRSPMRQLPGIQDGYNRKGLISNRGEKKEAFFVLQKTYREWASHGAASGVSLQPVRGANNGPHSPALAWENISNPDK